MKAIVMGDGNISVEEVSLPKIKSENDVLIKIAYASICGYDMMVLNGNASGNPDGAVGHEASGIIVEIGSGVDEDYLQVGTRVTMESYKACMLCENCRAGRPEYCENLQGQADFMREYIVIDKLQVHRLPDNISLKEGCLTEPLIMAMHALDRANLSAGKSLLILGAGAMGQIMIKLARLMPLSLIAVAEPAKTMQELALKNGADVIIDTKVEKILSQTLALSDGRGFDAIIEASGSRKSAGITFQMLARGGAAVFFALYGMEYEQNINLFQLYWKDASISGVGVPSFSFPKALNVLHKIGLEDVITAIFPFREAPKAFAEKLKPGHAKIMLEFAGDT